MTKQEIMQMIQARAIAAGMDPKHALTIASIETGGTFDPKSANKQGYKGLFQFGPNEWQTWGKNADIFDPTAQMDAFLGYHGDIKTNLAKTLGRDPTGPEMYLGWQQGAGGAGKLLTNPDVPAATLIGNDAWAANGGKGPQTASGFGNMWRGKYNEHQAGLEAVPDAAPAPAAVAPDIDTEIKGWSQYGDKPYDWTAAISRGLKGLGSSGSSSSGGLLAQGAPQAQPLQGQAVQAHVPQMQAGLLNPFQAQADEMRKRQMLGLLGNV